MADTKVAKRYAKSLLDYGIEKNLVDSFNDDMLLLGSALSASKPLLDFMKSPVKSADDKIKVLSDLFSGKIQDVTFDFFRLIVNKKREYFIDRIAHAYSEMYDAYKGRQIAWLTTASPVDDEVRKQMLDLIAKTTSNKITLKEKVDPSIIGGFVLTWGDRQFDTSVSLKLHNLRQGFRTNLYIKDY